MDPLVFDASEDALVHATRTVLFKDRPFGISAYAPSSTGKGALVWELGRERYPRDPQGRAAREGVKRGFAVRRVGGVDVSRWDFWDIMDVLDDKVLDNSSGKFQSRRRGPTGMSAAPLPVEVEFVEFHQDRGMLVGATSVPTLGTTATSTVTGLLAYPPGCTVDDAYVDRFVQVQKDNTGSAVLGIEDAIRLVQDAMHVLRCEDTLRMVDVDSVVVVGDLHGQFYDLLRIFELAGPPGEGNPYLFNGDFVDRGSYSLEVMFTLLALKLRFPRAVLLNRGNHEAVHLNLRYGFAAEIRARYGADGQRLFEAFSEAFRWLPLAHVLNSEVFVVHGGLPGPDPRLPFADAGGLGTGYAAVAPAQDGATSGRRGGGQHLDLLGYNPDNVSLPPRRREMSLAEIAALPRGVEPVTDFAVLNGLPEDEAEMQRILVDLLWADPRGKTGYGPSFRVQRGCYIFGPDVTEAFLQQNGLRLVIRSHEVKVSGYEFTHPSLISVFSAANYLGHAKNKGAIVRLTRNAASGHLEPVFITYEAGDQTVYKAA